MSDELLTPEERKPFVQCSEEEAVWDIDGLLREQIAKVRKARQDDCPECGGEGSLRSLRWDVTRRCPRCNGTGKRQDEPTKEQKLMYCGDCKYSSAEDIPDGIGGYQGQGDYYRHITCSKKLPTQSECFKKGLLATEAFNCLNFRREVSNPMRQEPDREAKLRLKFNDLLVNCSTHFDNDQLEAVLEVFDQILALFSKKLGSPSREKIAEECRSVWFTNDYDNGAIWNKMATQIRDLFPDVEQAKLEQSSLDQLNFDKERMEFWAKIEEAKREEK